MEDLAASLLETQAQRATHKGIASSPDTTWDHEFEAAFPYEETPDQHTVIDEIRVDMQSNRPMDRLICGDAGYGKTELAMRAAFKTVMQERQVALLVPTTVLAQQHFDTFRERMSPYPINIAMLSRFCSASERADTIDSLQKGTTDIVIGTHALIQPKISFKKLGVVIIDEEQRFGVKHKEQFKKVRSLVDVLTMTATPIPRTLYMSLTGARDLSLLQTPPRQRVPIDTRVVRDSDETIRNAILHELHRNGQIYFLYNRVMTIDAMYERLQRIVPEARIAVGHGQMPAKQLANIMHEFSAGKHDVLLCTTIIESGVDIPRANTILIHRADRFGIADLYQLRGRVGRSNRKAFAYLMLPSHGNVDSHARKRISAIRTHSGLGAGFRLAMRDLEIRGAGNMLGSAQSGHIAAMGFSLYCQLLKRTVARLKGEPLPNLVDVELRLDFIDLSIHSEDSLSGACLPLSYIEDDQQRLGVYRRIAEAVDENEIKDVRNDMRDRFGSMPPQTERLIRLNEIRIHAAARNITRIECRNKQLRFYRDNKLMNINGQNASGSTPDQTLKNLKNFICRIPTSD